MANIPICIDCGLTVNDEGSLIVNTGNATNPYATTTCNDADLSPIICGDDGILRGLPNTKFRFNVSATNNFISGTHHNTPVPMNITGAETVVFTLDTTNLVADGLSSAAFKNPSDCRPALVIEEVEYDVDIDVPVGAQVRTFINSDRMWQHTNTGNSTETDEGVQTTKVFFSLLAPGATFAPSHTMAVGAGGSGTPVLRRKQYTYRIAILAIG